MPAIANIVLKDAATTPVSHTFAPANAAGSGAEWADRSPGIASAYPVLSHQVRKASQPAAANRILMGLNVPVTAVVDGVTKVVRNSSLSIAINCAQDSTEQERKDLIAYAQDLLANASVKQTVQNIEPFY